MGAAANYRRLFTRGGRRVTLERRVVNAATILAEGVRARIRGLTPEEVAGGTSINERKALILAEDVPAGFAPVKKGDAILVDGLRLMITERPDDQTHRYGEVLLAYDCILAGS